MMKESLKLTLITRNRNSTIKVVFQNSIINSFFFRRNQPKKKKKKKKKKMKSRIRIKEN